MPFNERIHFPNITCRDAVSIHTGNGMDTLLRLVIQSESFHSVTILKLIIIANLRNIMNQILFKFQSLLNRSRV